MQISEKNYFLGALFYVQPFLIKEKKTDYKALRLRSCHVRILALKRSLIFHLFVHPLASLTALSRAHLCHGPLSVGQTRGAHFPARWRPDCNVGEVGRIIMLFPVAELEMNTDISPWTLRTFSPSWYLIYTVRGRILLVGEEMKGGGQNWTASQSFNEDSCLPHSSNPWLSKVAGMDMM